MDEKKVAIQVKGLEKAYKLYDKPSDRLKEALGFGRKKRYKERRWESSEPMAPASLRS